MKDSRINIVIIPGTSGLAESFGISEHRGNELIEIMNKLKRKSNEITSLIQLLANECETHNEFAWICMQLGANLNDAGYGAFKGRSSREDRPLRHTTKNLDPEVCTNLIKRLMNGDYYDKQ